MMIKMKIKRKNIQTRILLLALGILITILIMPIQVSATVVLDPVDPYFISEGEIPEGEELDIYYYLEKGQPYHIFMVGDWVEDNESRTDYDIFTRKCLKIETFEKRFNYFYGIKDLYRYIKDDSWLKNQEKIKELIKNIEDFLSKELAFYQFYLIIF